MADLNIPNLTSAIDGWPRKSTYANTIVRIDLPYRIDKNDGIFPNPIRPPESNGGLHSVGNISFDDPRTKNLPDSLSFASTNKGQDRPALGKLYPRYTK